MDIRVTVFHSGTGLSGILHTTIIALILTMIAITILTMDIIRGGDIHHTIIIAHIMGRPIMDITIHTM